MKPITEEKRQALIELCQNAIKEKPTDAEEELMQLLAQVALASLEADVKCYSYKEYVWATGLCGYVWREKIEDEKPETCESIKEVKPLYTAPPVPVMQPVKMPVRISNIYLRSPLEVEDMYRDFMAAALRAAGYDLKEH